MANPFDEQIIEAPVGPGPTNRQNILLKKNSRRSTLLVRPQNQTEPPTENPVNSVQTNDQLKQEYGKLQSLNRVLETVLENFEDASEKIQQFTDTVNKTDKLLDLWLAVLERAEETKSVLEDKHWHVTVSKSSYESSRRIIYILFCLY
jgi:transcriptional regulator of nitric oxide reductase